VRIPISEVEDGTLHLYTVNAGNQSLRFLIIKSRMAITARRGRLPDLRCGRYRQDGQNVICRHCGSAIYVPSVEITVVQPDRCSVARGWWRSGIDLSSLTQGAKEILSGRNRFIVPLHGLPRTHVPATCCDSFGRRPRHKLLTGAGWLSAGVATAALSVSLDVGNRAGKRISQPRCKSSCHATGRFAAARNRRS